MLKPITVLIAVGSLLGTQPLMAAAKVAVAHFAPFAENVEDTSVDISVNGTVALEDVKFKDFTDYIDFEPGDYTIDVYLAGMAETSEPIITGEFMLEDGVAYTLFATGNGITQTPVLLALANVTLGFWASKEKL